MKAKLLLAVVLTAGLTMAAKIPQSFVEGQFEGFTKPYVEPTVTNVSGVTTVTFPDMGAKGTITITKLPTSDVLVNVECAANIKTKKCDGYINNLTDNLSGSKINAKMLVVSDTLDCSKGCIKTLKLQYVGKELLAGANPKGAKITMLNSFAGHLDGNVKSITAASFNEAQLRCTTPKTLAIKAKNKDGGTAYVNPGLSYKAKNVLVTEAEEKFGLKIDLATGEITLEALPGEWEAEDKTKYLWLQKIEPQTFTMGSEMYVDNPSHEVTLTKACWMGVFEVTNGQILNLGWTYPGISLTDALKPAGNVNYEDLRGEGAGYDWPSCGHLVSATSFFGVLRQKVLQATGTNYVFDLPTDAQWECACRAGHYGDVWNDGGEVGTEGYPDKLAWYRGNAAGTLQDVGTRVPNSWGFYDMHGNAAEWNLDYYGNLSADPVSDPVGPTSGKYRERRAGSVTTNVDMLYSGKRSLDYPSSREAENGFRVCLHEE